MTDTDLRTWRGIAIATVVGLLFWALLICGAVSAFAQEEEFYRQQPKREQTEEAPAHGREMTEEEKREFQKWIDDGKPEVVITQSKPKAIGIDWEKVAHNPITWLCAAIVIVSALALRELNGIQTSVNVIEQINERQKQILAEDIEREIEREKRGEVLPPKDPNLAAWWDEVKRAKERSDRSESYKQYKPRRWE
jgi:hypothetical protein